MVEIQPVQQQTPCNLSTSIYASGERHSLTKNTHLTPSPHFNMRISIPTLPNPTSSSSTFINPLANITLPRAVDKTLSFLEKGKGKALVLTGAGVSVDSGIRAYRGNDGHYTTNPNYRPIFYGELVEPGSKGDQFRKRYWSRSYLGYPPVRDAKPNPTHMYVAALQRAGLAPKLITQNVSEETQEYNGISS